MPFRRNTPLSLVLAAAMALAPLAAQAGEAAAPATTESVMPLPAGEAAGVEKAQGFSFDRIPWLFIAGFSIVAIAVAIALADSSSSSDTIVAD